MLVISRACVNVCCWFVLYLHQLHHWDGVEEVKAAESVQSVGGAGDVGDGQRGRVAGKDGVSNTRQRRKQMRNNQWFVHWQKDTECLDIPGDLLQ